MAKITQSFFLPLAILSLWNIYRLNFVILRLHNISATFKFDNKVLRGAF